MNPPKKKQKNKKLEKWKQTITSPRDTRKERATPATMTMDCAESDVVSSDSLP